MKKNEQPRPQPPSHDNDNNNDDDNNNNNFVADDKQVTPDTESTSLQQNINVPLRPEEQHGQQKQYYHYYHQQESIISSNSNKPVPELPHEHDKQAQQKTVSTTTPPLTSSPFKVDEKSLQKNLIPPKPPSTSGSSRTSTVTSRSLSSNPYNLKAGKEFTGQDNHHEECALRDTTVSLSSVQRTLHEQETKVVHGASSTKSPVRIVESQRPTTTFLEPPIISNRYDSTISSPPSSSSYKLPSPLRPPNAYMPGESLQPRYIQIDPNQIQNLGYIIEPVLPLQYSRHRENQASRQDHNILQRLQSSDHSKQAGLEDIHQIDSVSQQSWPFQSKEPIPQVYAIGLPEPIGSLQDTKKLAYSSPNQPRGRNEVGTSFDSSHDTPTSNTKTSLLPAVRAIPRSEELPDLRFFHTDTPHTDFDITARDIAFTNPNPVATTAAASAYKSAHSPHVVLQAVRMAGAQFHYKHTGNESSKLSEAHHSHESTGLYLARSSIPHVQAYEQHKSTAKSPEREQDDGHAHQQLPLDENLSNTVYKNRQHIQNSAVERDEDYEIEVDESEGTSNNTSPSTSNDTTPGYVRNIERSNDHLQSSLLKSKGLAIIKFFFCY